MFTTATHHQEWIKKVQLSESNDYTFNSINAPTQRLNCKLSHMQMKRKKCIVYLRNFLQKILFYLDPNIHNSRKLDDSMFTIM